LLPLTTARRQLGTLTFACKQPSAFDEADVGFLQLVANHVAVVHPAEASRAENSCGSRLPSLPPEASAQRDVYSQQLPDGSTERLGDWPAPCAVCGQVPEMIIQIVRPLLAEAKSASGWDSAAGLSTCMYAVAGWNLHA
jgi:hypothetical protein